MRVLIALLLLTSPAYAYPAGYCKSSEPFYKNIQFSLEESTDSTYAIMFAKDQKGQFITDKDTGTYYIIWNDHVAAPDSQYQCFRVEGE